MRNGSRKQHFWHSSTLSGHPYEANATWKAFMASLLLRVINISIKTAAVDCESNYSRIYTASTAAKQKALGSYQTRFYATTISGISSMSKTKEGESNYFRTHTSVTTAKRRKDSRNLSNILVHNHFLKEGWVSINKTQVSYDFIGRVFTVNHLLLHQQTKEKNADGLKPSTIAERRDILIFPRSHWISRIQCHMSSDLLL